MEKEKIREKEKGDDGKEKRIREEEIEMKEKERIREEENGDEEREQRETENRRDRQCIGKGMWGEEGEKTGEKNIWGRKRGSSLNGNIESEVTNHWLTIIKHTLNCRKFYHAPYHHTSKEQHITNHHSSTHKGKWTSQHQAIASTHNTIAGEDDHQPQHNYTSYTPVTTQLHIIHTSHNTTTHHTHQSQHNYTAYTPVTTQLHSMNTSHNTTTQHKHQSQHNYTAYTPVTTQLHNIHTSHNTAVMDGGWFY
ncbi:hypothetical protein Pmani_014073 [Petrolisthes manimaculis]|uniref:Uncharacterized protein n=1 Tax=Petrolisthes manimaculis TaxID=1843537 RepID=A0AAE1PUP9_9EUCA|nr:hypothetical protein Pmani_014073 [Petrolisthes manimaculis]